MRRAVFCSLLASGLAAAALAAPQTLVVGTYPQRMADRYPSGTSALSGRITWIDTAEGRVTAGMGAAVAELRDGRWEPALHRQARPRMDLAGLPPGAEVLDLAREKSGRTWVVTTQGVYRTVGARLMPFGFPRRYLTRQKPVNTDATFSSVAVDGSGLVWLGSDAGIFATDGAEYWHALDRTRGLPYEYVTCLAFGPDASLWAGTRQGVCRYRDGEWEYYWGPRWLPNNHVNDLAVDKSGAAWVATDGGIARLYDHKLTLEEKARHYQAITDSRHHRRGYVTGSRLRKPGDPSAGAVIEASDNDGLWTAVYVGAQAFRWAATKDPAARAAAKTSMEAMLDLVRLSGYPGFPARAVLRKGEEADGYNPDETVRVPGEKDKIWYQSPVDPNVLCKGDTSSDELDGHYFAWSVYYDLVADEEEKRAIRAAVVAVTNNLLDHDLNLVGHTGRKTRWGVYSPKYINDDPTWWEERGLNSLSMLSYLKLAEHVTGDARYTRKYRELIEKHHYLLNTLEQKVAGPWEGVNHSDDQMAFMMYYNLMKLERDPAVRLVLLKSLERSWRVERPEHSPFFNFVYGAAADRPCDVEASVAELQSWPWELVEWEVRGSHRHDVTVRVKDSEGRRHSELTRALPAAERRLMRWNGNPYQADGGTPDGRTEEDGSAWLLPYWMGRHYGFIDERGPAAGR